MKKFILVTGGAGYIGSIVCEILLKDGYNVIVIDDLRDGKSSALSNEVIFFEGNYGDPLILDNVFNTYSVDFIFHFAASANVPDSVKNPELYYENNFINTFKLLINMKKHEVKKIIFSSTAAVFGEPISLPIDELHPKNPINPYGYSKLMIEQMLRDFSNAYGMQFIIFRYFCAAGATLDHGESRLHETHLIPIVLDNALKKNKFINVFGDSYQTKDGTGIRDYIHVLDIAKAHILGMKYFDQNINEDFNLGTNHGFSVLEILNEAEILLNTKLNYTITEKREGDPAVLVATNKKAKEKLGWIPDYTIQDIISSSFIWRKNPKY